MGILTFSFKDYRHAKEFARTGQLNYRYIDIAWKMSKSQFGFRAIRGGFQFHQYCLVNGDENRCSLFFINIIQEITDWQLRVCTDLLWYLLSLEVSRSSFD